MKNKNRPFFYEKKRTPFHKVLLRFLAVFLLLTFAGLQVPIIRQVISTPLYAAGSFFVNSVKSLFEMTKMYHEPEKKRQTYPQLEFPDAQVLFAESLENLAALSNEDPLSDLRQTPTPSEYSRVAEWEYLDPNLNYAVSSGNSPQEEITKIQLVPPVFERSDLFNDGAAILSADLRFWGITENQYNIAQKIHPDSFDPFISFSDISGYLESSDISFQTVQRFNGDKEILINLLRKDIPVLILVEQKSNYLFWPGDDQKINRYYLILGYDSQSGIFSYQDTFGSNTLEISENELLSIWYPCQRTYLVIYPETKDSDVRDALSENYFEELNYQKALAKFRTDSEMMPNDPYAQYNYGVLLHKLGDNDGAWEQFQKAAALTLPQRYMYFQTDMLQTALELGYADDIEFAIKPLMKYNDHNEVLNVYQGWAEILRENYQNGSDLFEKAKKINPNSETVIYALKYRDTMLNY